MNNKINSILCTSLYDIKGKISILLTQTLPDSLHTCKYVDLSSYQNKFKLK